MFNFCRIWIGLKKRERSKIRIDKSYLVKSTTVFDFPLWSGWQSTFLGLFIGPAWIFSGSHHICSQPDAASTPWSWILANTKTKTNTNTQQIHQNLSTCSFTGGTALYARHQFARHRMVQRIVCMCQKHQNHMSDSLSRVLFVPEGLTCVAAFAVRWKANEGIFCGASYKCKWGTVIVWSLS